MSQISFQYPYLLLLLLTIPMMIFYQWYFDKKRNTPVLYSDLSQFNGAKTTLRIRLRKLPDWLRMLAVGLLVVAIARPQTHLSKDERSIEGIDIVLALDVSTSMLAEDFKPNRLESAKEVAEIAKVKTEATVAGFQAGIIDLQAAQKELKKLEEETGMFGSLTDEEIAANAGRTYQDVTALRDPLAGLTYGE